MSHKIIATAYQREEDSKYEAFRHGTGWIVRYIGSPVYFWKPDLRQWVLAHLVEGKAFGEHYMNFGEAMLVLDTVGAPPF